MTKTDIGWLLAGYVGLAGFLVLEGTSRRDSETPDMSEADDSGTTRGIVVAYGACALFTPLVAAVPQRWRLGWRAPIVGVVLQAAGLWLRRLSMETLGGSYTRTVRASSEQPLVDDGPYRIVRHPGYLASILIWIGFALTSRSPLAVGLVSVLMGRAYSRRMLVEEQVLIRDVAGYDSYRRRTYRLLPFIW